MLITDAQRDMRHAYFDGATGVLASGLVWLCAAVVALLGSADRSIAALFIGGMFIHPLAVLLARLLGRSGNHTRGNPLGALAMEGTIFMLMCLPLVYFLSRWRLDYFFPAMLMVIGGRYLTFATLYGNRLYWVLGAVLGLAAWALVSFHASFVAGAFTGAGLEIAYAAILFACASPKRVASGEHQEGLS